MATKKPKKRTRQRAKVNKVTANYRVTEELWAVLQPLLPTPVNSHRFGGGRPRVPDRQCADAIFYVLRTGCQWGALDATGLCPHSTAHRSEERRVGKEWRSRAGRGALTT